MLIVATVALFEGYPTLLLAEGAANATNPLVQFLPFVLIAVLAYFLLIVPKRNEQQRFQSMLDELKENDRVVTVGGLHGVVTSVQRDQQRVTLRIDESSGTKVRISFWAIDSVEKSGEAKQANKSNK